jgi:uncharacterized protein (TIGR02118 family)
MSESNTVHVLYPRKEDATFDIDYYLKTHMPLAYKTWNSFGFTSYKVTKYPDDAPYSYGVTMEWEDMERFAKALQAEGTKAVMDDVKNYSDVQPIILSGEVVGSG